MVVEVPRVHDQPVPDPQQLHVGHFPTKEALLAAVLAARLERRTATTSRPGSG
jgi:hypothetical protein